MVDFTFDHRNNDIFKACGVKEEQIEELFDKMNEVGQTCTSQSECIEKVAENFSRTELSFVINHLQSQVRHLQENNPMSMLREMFGGGDDDDDDISLLGSGGDA